MNTAVTNGIKITVTTDFEQGHSDPYRSQFLFSYRIAIENMGEETVQLVRRRWCIHDSSGEYREVEGEGVVGAQPVLEPGESYTYESACNLSTDAGKMHGTYTMQRVDDPQDEFEVRIPEFKMIVPFRLN